MESASDVKAIHVIMDTEQSFIQHYNDQVLNNKEKIPIVPRNRKTGWPLLQISMFTFDIKKQKYEPALGGGKCHDLNLYYYFLAELLTKTFYYDKSKSNFNYNLGVLIREGKIFNVQLKPPLQLVVSSNSGPMSYTTYEITLNNNPIKELIDLLNFIHPLLIKPNVNIFDINYRGYNYTEKEIKDNINQEFCTFEDGQIYFDLGNLFLKKYKIELSERTSFTTHVSVHDESKNTQNDVPITEVDDGITDMFKTIFQVDKFKEVYEQHLKTEKEKPPVLKEEIKIEPVEKPRADVKQLFGNRENKLKPEALCLELVKLTNHIQSPLEKLKTLELFFLDVINKNEITYEYFRPSMSIFFNNKICNTQKEDIKSIKLAYMMVIKKALLDEGMNLSLREKNEIINHTRQENNLIDYHTKFLFGYTNTRNSFDRLVTYAYQNGFLSEHKKVSAKKKDQRH